MPKGELLDAAPRSLRRDAVANRGKIIAAARAAVDAHGLDVSMEAIAQMAGVGIGTLYRNFSTKQDLLDVIVAEAALAVRDAAIVARDIVAPSGAVAAFILGIGEVHADHPRSLKELWRRADPAILDEVQALGRSVLDRARSAGAVRDDLVYEDILVAIWSIRGVIETTYDVAPSTWRRHGELLVQAMAPGGPPLTNVPLTTTGATAVRSRGARRNDR